MALFIVDYYYYCGYDCGYSSGCGCLGFYYRVEGWVGHPSCTCPSPVMHLPGDDDERATPRTTRNSTCAPVARGMRRRHTRQRRRWAWRCTGHQAGVEEDRG